VGGSIGTTADGGNTWNSRSRNVTSETLYNCNAIANYTNIYVGSNGLILKTTDAGNSFSVKNSSSGVLFYDSHFIDANTGWAVGSKIMKTINGGDTWTEQVGTLPIYLFGVHFTDASHGWAVGDGGRMMKTINGGTTWDTIVPVVSSWLKSIYFSNTNKGWATGSDGVVLSTINAGNTWNVQYLSGVFSDVYFVNDSVGFVAGDNGKAYKTINGGTNWTLMTTGINEDLEDVFFTDKDTGWMVGWKGTVLSTVNGGSTWINKSFNTTRRLLSVSLLNAGSGCICGEAGSIAGTSMISGIADHDIWNKKIISAAAITAIYPNPFSQATKIEYEVTQDNEITLEILDPYGRVVSRFFTHKMHTPGKYIVNFAETSKLSSGIYFCRLYGNGFTESKKIIIQR
jgi:photosystem II stability/assembly factor-like uncharacterized protein